MTRYLGGIPVSDLGALQITPKPSTLPTGAKFNKGWAVDPTSSFVYTADAGAAVPATAVYQAGIAFTPDGGLYVTESTSGSFKMENGYLIRSDGALLVNVGTPSTQFLAGFARHLTNQGLYVGGDGASFWLPFTDLGNGEVSILPGIGGVTGTFTRATAATTVLSTGLIASVSSGVARSYYDPETLTYLGYLAEGARTNLLLRSQEFDSASWTKVDTTITADDTTSPDGTANADLFTEGTAGTAQTHQTVTATADVNYAATMFVKRGNVDWVRLRLQNGANAVNGWFNINTGAVGSTTVGGTGAAVAIRIKAYPSGWYRCELVGSIGSAATAINTSIRSASADGGAVVNNATYYAWGAQFENNVSFASSYIPTTTASVTRNADVLTYSTITPFFNAAEGTLVARAVPLVDDPAGSQPRIAAFTDGTANELLLIDLNTSTDNYRGTAVDGGVTQVAFNTLGAPTYGTLGTVALAYRVNDFAGAANGGTVATDASGTVPTVDRLCIGHLNGAGQLFGPISSTSYYPVRLPNATLQSLTT